MVHPVQLASSKTAHASRWGKAAVEASPALQLRLLGGAGLARMLQFQKVLLMG